MTDGRQPGRPVAILTALTMLLLSGCSSFQPYPEADSESMKPVVAVNSFENRSNFSGKWKLGGGMADLLVSELVASEQFTVVERQHLGDLVGEIRNQSSPLFREEGRVEQGRLINASYLVRGVVNDFSQIGGGGFFVRTRDLLIGGRSNKARVALTLTLVDVETGRIVDSVNCAGLAKAREAYSEGRYRGMAFGGDAFFKTPLGKATQDAIRDGVRELIRKTPRDLWKPMIAEVRDDGVIVNAGANRNVRVGEIVKVRGAGRVVTDPATGDVLSIVPGPKVIGKLQITSVEATYSVAEVLEGNGFRRGQNLEAQ